jgi:NitT/TauT family transport system substrate-binding protein
VLNTVTSTDMSSGLVVRADHLKSGRYQSIKDLKGMKVAGGASGSSANYNVLKALSGGGLASNDVEFVAKSFADALAALGDSSIDAAFEVEPFISVAQNRGVARLVKPSSETSSGVASILVYGNADFVNANTSAVERYVTALMRGQRDYHAAINAASDAGREDMYAALMKYTSLKDRAQLAQLHFPTVDVTGVIDVDAMIDLQKFFVMSGGLQKTLTADQIIDKRYAAVAVTRIDASK